MACLASYIVASISVHVSDKHSMASIERMSKPSQCRCSAHIGLVSCRVLFWSEVNADLTRVVSSVLLLACYMADILPFGQNAAAAAAAGIHAVATDLGISTSFLDSDRTWGFFGLCILLPSACTLEDADCSL